MKAHVLQLLLLSTAAFAESLVDQTDEKVTPEPCKVRAWVRAEDLSPDHVSRGELRIKVSRVECANQVASVALRLQFDEFGEVKYLKKGAVIPEVQASNQTASVESLDWMANDVVLDYQAHDDAKSDPELWTVRAEERRVWATEATLLDNNPDLSHPIVTPFTVVVPAVNYPPVTTRYRNLYEPVPQHAFSDLGYRYMALVKFVNGRTEDVLAGHTTFAPSSETRPHPVPFIANQTFADPGCEREYPTARKRAERLESCLPEAQRSTFVAEITLEDGNVVQQGQTLKGRVTVRGTNGSTVMARLSLRLWSLSRHPWAQTQAEKGGDMLFYNATSGMCRGESALVLDANSPNFDYVFNDTDNQIFSTTVSTHQELSLTKPYIDFELELPRDVPVDFASYYSHSESSMRMHLDVIYSRDVAKCMQPNSLDVLDEEISTEDSVKTEEGLWDVYTPIGKPRQDESQYYRTLTLAADIPVVVVSHSSVNNSIPHYLSPGALAPVLQRGTEAEKPGSFPLVEPVFIVEALANTSARLMQSGTSDPAKWRQKYMNFSRRAVMNSDPTQDYRGGSYAGLLWRKKVVAEERGIWPLPAEVVEGGDNQEPFSIPH
ncbi:hypothetical protein B0H16DRAFT_1898493 [Mycena metata]|uniref:Uncharacterized protein n=1 Tax=Mycena metata TaxID=1033252 RepID=A0AAD7HAQ5_9AGAR|nr:hypothetical protein B0H16DRAFT_1898493 [Mycena metata]